MKFEYLTVVITNDGNQLNKLGSDGWRLVACIPQASDSLFCAFMREKEEKEADDTAPVKTRKRA